MNKTQNFETRESAPSFVTFRVDRRTFALPLSVVVQILPMMTITPIPQISRLVKGTINLHGQSVVVISLRTHFDMEEESLQLYTPMLLARVEDRTLALIVDEMREVLAIPAEKITTLETILPDGIQKTPMLRGIFYSVNDTILVLDPEKLFYVPEKIYEEHVKDVGAVFDQIASTTPAPAMGPKAWEQQPVPKNELNNIDAGLQPIGAGVSPDSSAAGSDTPLEEKS
ncbi:MAG: chemotaxis protein CheW [Anaerolineales bacterium]|nr:chemotaxis protein CheW [Anaerolineales bacterium]